MFNIKMNIPLQLLLHAKAYKVQSPDQIQQTIVILVDHQIPVRKN